MTDGYNWYPICADYVVRAEMTRQNRENRTRVDACTKGEEDKGKESEGDQGGKKRHSYAGAMQPRAYNA